MKIVNFADLKKSGKKLLLEGGYVDVGIFHKIEFSQPIIWNDMGISFNNGEYIECIGDDIDDENDFDLTNKNARDISVIDAIQFNSCLFLQHLEISNKNIQSIEFYDCVFEYDFSYLKKEFSRIGIKCKFYNCTKWGF